MKISRMIRYLNYLKKKHGDIDLIILSHNVFSSLALPSIVQCNNKLVGIFYPRVLRYRIWMLQNERT